MRFLPILLLAGFASNSIAAPYPNRQSRAITVIELTNGGGNNGSGNQRTGNTGASNKGAGKKGAAAAVGAGTATNETAGEGENANKIDQAGVFDKAIALKGGDVQQDTLFTKSAVGALEVEFANRDARTLTVTENKKPAAPPVGFQALEPSSFKINLKEGADGLTLQKVDYVIDAASPAVAGIDISKSQVGKLCTETNTFVVGAALGELEFEADENEISLTVNNMNGEWGIFVPVAAAAGGAAKEAAGEEEEGSTDVPGVFNTAIATPAGNQKNDIQFPPNEAGALEVEVNATLANAVTVANGTPGGKPPAGFLFVDPQSFKISTKGATNPVTDEVKVDYKFSQAVLAAVDPTQGRVGKLDTTTNQFVVDGVGEFEFEADENEWSLTVPDLNGEWAILIPQAGVL